MKQIIDGRLYNTETATELHSTKSSYSYTDFHYYEETLYQTKKGRFFLAGSGNAMTKYSQACGNCRGGGAGIIVLDDAEAKQWCEQHMDADAYAELFNVEEA